jgi:hypothetical protein
MRLVAIDAFSHDETLFAGIHQSVLGEIGFRADTRVYGVQVAKIQELSQWYGSAQGADSLTGDGPLARSQAEVGGAWLQWEGGLLRSERGVVGQDQQNSAILMPSSPTGLIHVLIDCDDRHVDGVAVIWRAADERNFWCFEVGSAHAQLAIVEEGRWQRFPRVVGRQLPPNSVSTLQVYDDGEAIRIHVNGTLIYGSGLHDKRLHSAAGVGLRIAGSQRQSALRSFEAHSRQIRIPGIAELGGPRLALGQRAVLADEFDGAPGDLVGHLTTLGSQRWERQIGKGVIALTGHRSARVQANAQAPCPGRTAYTVAWPNPELADLEVVITPPGKSPGTPEKGRAGLIFWQDADNYLILSAFLDDWPAMSIAAFFQVDGFDELYDAVWSNVGSRMHWGEPHTFRVVFDGHEFTAYINAEPVLYRALSDVYPQSGGFRVNRVGIVANWEWGNDTGSAFERFVGRSGT